MLFGVLLGIGVAQLLTLVIGKGTVALGVIVFFTFLAALATGIGLFAEGMMFANQAAISAILVVTLPGISGERAVDVLIGGGVALVLGVGLFPANPLLLVRDSELSVLEVLARILEQVAGFVRENEKPPEGWALDATQRVHEQLASMTRARSTAHAGVRIAPRRWRQRSRVDAEIARTEQLELLANEIVSTARHTAVQLENRERVPADREAQLSTLASSIRRLEPSRDRVRRRSS